MKKAIAQFFEALGIPLNAMRFREVDSDERAFYAKECWDFEVNTSLGWVELAANNYRTDYDLKVHMEGSKQDLNYVNPDGSKFIPHVWENSIGLDRTFYCVLEHAYTVKGDRVILSLTPNLAPVEVCVFPLLSNKPDLVSKAKEIYSSLKSEFDCFFDVSGSIGKRYARMDEVGVPFCLTIDFDSLNNADVTIRDRDSGAQKRVLIKDLKSVLTGLLS